MTEKHDVDPERRGALVWMVRGFLALWAPAAAGMAASFLKAPSPENRPGERMLRGGPMSSIAVGDARLVRHGTDPVYVVSSPQDFEAERTRLATLIDRVVQRGAAKTEGRIHHFFGRLSGDQWGCLIYKHFDHHLRQFGV